MVNLSVRAGLFIQNVVLYFISILQGAVAMKLSMWIIANLLELFEPEIHIQEESARVLRSARLAQATNCVYVRKDGPNCLYEWNGDTILVPDLSAREGYELLQSLFDSMFDWHSQMSRAAEDHDYQRIVDLCHPVFRNPVVLFDANHKCLAMSTQYGPEDVDAEWHHLKTYGYPSFTFSRQLDDSVISYHMSGEIIRFHFDASSHFSSNLSTHLLQDGLPVGYLTVIEKDHPLNYGHMQLIQVVSQLLTPALAMQNPDSDERAPFLQQLLEGSPIPEEISNRLYEQKHWRPEHSYRILVPDFGRDTDAQQLRERYYHFSALSSVLSEDICGIYDGRLVILANDSLLPQDQRLARINHVLEAFPIQIGISLSMQGFSYLPELFRQAVFALEYLGPPRPDIKYLDFYGCAVDYLIRTPYSPRSCLAACHPDVYRLYRYDEVLYRTLMVYLIQDRSVTKTIQYLYVHKNTMLHRLHKIEELLHYPLSDPYCRQYMRISFLLLERHAGLPDPPAPFLPENEPESQEEKG